MEERKLDKDQDKQDYSYSEDLADRIIRTREESSSEMEIVGWLQSVDHIISNYRDGYISNADINSKETFLSDSIYREAMLTTALGLYEKSKNPLARQKAEKLRTQIAKLRACRQKLNTRTPSRTVAKRIQARQEERLAKNNQNEIFEDDSPFLYTSPDNDKLMSAAIGLIGLDLALGVNAKECNKFIDSVVTDCENESRAAEGIKVQPENTGQEDPKIARMKVKFRQHAEMIRYMHRLGMTREQIKAVAFSRADDENSMRAIRMIYSSFEQLQPNPIDMLGSPHSDYAEIVRSAIDRHDAMHTNAYDYSIAQEVVAARLNNPNRSKEDIMAHLTNITNRRYAVNISDDRRADSLRKTAFAVDNYNKMIQSDRRSI